MIKRKSIFFHILISLIIVTISTLIALLMFQFVLTKESVIMVFLLGVIAITIVTKGYVYGIISSLISVMLFNFFFTIPIYTFVIDQSSDLILLVSFQVTAIVSASITTRLRNQREISSANEKTAQLISKLATGFLHVTGKDNIIRLAMQSIKDCTGYDSKISIIKTNETYESSASWVQEVPLKNYVIQNNNEVIGNIQIFGEGQNVLKQSDLIIKSVATQINIALDREYVYQEREKIQVAMESEKLRNTLLRSVAHDLRSPLTTLSGASTLLADRYETLSNQEKKQLALNISEEMVWLSKLVENILYMTRIADSKLELNKQEEAIDDVVAEAVEHMKRLMINRNFIVTLPEEVIVVMMDGKLIVQALVNLLDNAVKHTKQKDTIELEVKVLDQDICFVVKDTGEGVESKIKDTLFDGFITSSRIQADGKRGIGLGLAICKAIVEAHEGTIWMEKNEPKGSLFSFKLPYGR